MTAQTPSLDWGRLAYVLALIGPVDIDDTEDAFVAYTEEIRKRYLASGLEDDPQYANYVARLATQEADR